MSSSSLSSSSYSPDLDDLKYRRSSLSFPLPSPSEHNSTVELDSSLTLLATAHAAIAAETATLAGLPLSDQTSRASSAYLSFVHSLSDSSPLPPLSPHITRALSPSDISHLHHLQSGRPIRHQHIIELSFQNEKILLAFKDLEAEDQAERVKLKMEQAKERREKKKIKEKEMEMEQKHQLSPPIFPSPSTLSLPLSTSTDPRRGSIMVSDNEQNDADTLLSSMLRTQDPSLSTMAVAAASSAMMRVEERGGGEAEKSEAAAVAFADTIIQQKYPNSQNNHVGPEFTMLNKMRLGRKNKESKLLVLAFKDAGLVEQYRDMMAEKEKNQKTQRFTPSPVPATPKDIDSKVISSLLSAATAADESLQQAQSKQLESADSSLFLKLKMGKSNKQQKLIEKALKEEQKVELKMSSEETKMNEMLKMKLQMGGKRGKRGSMVSVMEEEERRSREKEKEREEIFSTQLSTEEIAAIFAVRLPPPLLLSILNSTLPSSISPSPSSTSQPDDQRFLITSLLDDTWRSTPTHPTLENRILECLIDVSSSSTSSSSSSFMKSSQLSSFLKPHEYWLLGVVGAGKSIKMKKLIDNLFNDEKMVQTMCKIWKEKTDIYMRRKREGGGEHAVNNNINNNSGVGGEDDDGKAKDAAEALANELIGGGKAQSSLHGVEEEKEEEEEMEDDSKGILCDDYSILLTTLLHILPQFPEFYSLPSPLPSTPSPSLLSDTLYSHPFILKNILVAAGEIDTNEGKLKDNPHWENILNNIQWEEEKAKNKNIAILHQMQTQGGNSIVSDGSDVSINREEKNGEEKESKDNDNSVNSWLTPSSYPLPPSLSSSYSDQLLFLSYLSSMPPFSPTASPSLSPTLLPSYRLLTLLFSNPFTLTLLKNLHILSALRIYRSQRDKISRKIATGRVEGKKYKKRMLIVEELSGKMRKIFIGALKKLSGKHIIESYLWGGIESNVEDPMKSIREVLSSGYYEWDKSIKDNGDTMLHLAAKYGKGELVDFIMENGGDIVRNEEGKTALHMAISMWGEEAVQFSNNNNDGSDYNGSQSSFYSVIQTLLGGGADPSLSDHSNLTPISLSSSLPSPLPQIFQELLSSSPYLFCHWHRSYVEKKRRVEAMKSAKLAEKKRRKGEEMKKNEEDKDSKDMEERQKEEKRKGLLGPLQPEIPLTEDPSASSPSPSDTNNSSSPPTLSILPSPSSPLSDITKQRRAQTVFHELQTLVQQFGGGAGQTQQGGNANNNNENANTSNNPNNVSPSSSTDPESDILSLLKSNQDLVIEGYIDLNHHVEYKNDLSILLHDAVFYGKINVVRAFLNARSNANHQNMTGITPLHLGIMKIKSNLYGKSIVSLLLQAGGNMDIRDYRSGKNGMDYAEEIMANGGTTGDKDILQWLREWQNKEKLLNLEEQINAIDTIDKRIKRDAQKGEIDFLSKLQKGKMTKSKKMLADAEEEYNKMVGKQMSDEQRQMEKMKEKLKLGKKSRKGNNTNTSDGEVLSDGENAPSSPTVPSLTDLSTTSPMSDSTYQSLLNLLSPDDPSSSPLDIKVKLLSRGIQNLDILSEMRRLSEEEAAHLLLREKHKTDSELQMIRKMLRGKKGATMSNEQREELLRREKQLADASALCDNLLMTMMAGEEKVRGKMGREEEEAVRNMMEKMEKKKRAKEDEEKRLKILRDKDEDEKRRKRAEDEALKKGEILSHAESVALSTTVPLLHSDPQILKSLLAHLNISSIEELPSALLLSHCDINLTDMLKEMTAHEIAQWLMRQMEEKEAERKMLQKLMKKKEDKRLKEKREWTEKERLEMEEMERRLRELTSSNDLYEKMMSDILKAEEKRVKSMSDAEREAHERMMMKMAGKKKKKEGDGEEEKEEKGLMSVKDEKKKSILEERRRRKDLLSNTISPLSSSLSLLFDQHVDRNHHQCHKCETNNPRKIIINKESENDSKDQNIQCVNPHCLTPFSPSVPHLTLPTLLLLHRTLHHQCHLPIHHLHTLLPHVGPCTKSSFLHWLQILNIQCERWEEMEWEWGGMNIMRGGGMNEGMGREMWRKWRVEEGEGDGDDEEWNDLWKRKGKGEERHRGNRWNEDGEEEEGITMYDLATEVFPIPDPLDYF